MQFWALIVDSLRESLDRKIFWVVLAITLIVVGAMACIGFEDDKVSILFGAWEAETDSYDPSTPVGRSALIGVVTYLVMDVVLAWIGVILIIIATASFFPSLIEHGAIDVVLAKPISRVRLFLYKYLSSMVFVFIQAAIFIGLTFLVMGLRWGIWTPGYLLSIPLMVLLFSYIYCVSVLVAVKTRSSVAAILISLGAWFVFACPKMALDTFNSFPSLKEHERLYQTMCVASWIPPKTGDIPYLAARWAEAGTSLEVFPAELMEDATPEEQEQLERARAMEERELQKNPYLSIGTSLLFEGVIVLWAMSCFIRQDY